MNVPQKQLINRLFHQQQRHIFKGGVLALLRHSSRLTATSTDNLSTPLPFLRQAENGFDVVDSSTITGLVRPTVPTWKEAGLKIERNGSNQKFQIIAKQIVDECAWDNSVHDYALWTKAFGSNFSMFFALDKQRHPIGCVSMALYPQVAQWSMYFVKDRYRGHQLGSALFRRSMELTGDRPVFCYGVSDMWFKYAEDYGMNNLLDWRLCALHANCEDVRPERLDDDSSVELKEWREVSFDKLLSFDRLQTVGIDRTAYLQAALRLPQSLTKVAVSRETKEVVGSCQARTLLNRRIGISLFYADRPSIASALLRDVLLQFVGPDPAARFDSILYKTPSNNAESLRLFQQLIQNGPVDRQVFTPQFSRYALPFPGRRIYSISDQHASLI